MVHRHVPRLTVNLGTYLAQRCNMLLLLVQGIVAYAVFRVCWPIIHRLVVKTDLDNVPGPASHSLLRGECQFMPADIDMSIHVERKLVEGIRH
jgi:hypothetical protein